jgi:D-tyrosyl-tRNA(Tyr) deacylase
MSSDKKAVYFFCTKPGIDPVSGNVFDKLSELYNLQETNIIIDDSPVLSYSDEMGNRYFFVRTYKVVCHDYNHYLPIMNDYFSDFDFAGLVTWHEGQNAPDRIFSVHTTGDVESGFFGPANPLYIHISCSAWKKTVLQQAWKISGLQRKQRTGRVSYTMEEHRI